MQVTMYASPGAMVVAMDNIRLMKIIDESKTFSMNVHIKQIQFIAKFLACSHVDKYYGPRNSRPI